MVHLNGGQNSLRAVQSALGAGTKTVRTMPAALVTGDTVNTLILIFSEAQDFVKIWGKTQIHQPGFEARGTALETL